MLDVITRCKRVSLGRLLGFSFAVLMALGLPQLAMAGGFALPDPGVDVGAAITATITALGAVVLVAVGGYFAYLLIRKGMQWSRRAFG